MRTLHQLSTSDDEQIERPWLDEEYNKNYQRTLSLGKTAIDRLIKENKNITYNSIAEESKKCDEEKKGIHPNSVIRNKDLYEYYKKHSKTYARKKVLEDRKKPYIWKSSLNVHVAWIFIRIRLPHVL